MPRVFVYQDGGSFFADQAFGPFAEGDVIWQAPFKVPDMDCDTAELARKHFLAACTVQGIHPIF